MLTNLSDNQPKTADVNKEHTMVQMEPVAKDVPPLQQQKQLTDAEKAGNPAWYANKSVVLAGMVLFICAVFVTDSVVFRKPIRKRTEMIRAIWANTDHSNVANFLKQAPQSTWWADIQAKNKSRKIFVNPLLIIITFFLRGLGIFDETHKVGIQRFVLWVLIPCKIFSSLADLELSELGNEAVFSAISCLNILVTIALVCLPAYYFLGKLQWIPKEALLAVCLNLTVNAPAVSAYPFAADIHKRCLTSLIFLDFPNKIWGLGISGLILFQRYGKGMFSFSKALKKLLTHPAIIALYLGVLCILIGNPITLSQNANQAVAKNGALVVNSWKFDIICQTIQTVGELLGATTMIFIGMSMKVPNMDNIGQLSAVFFRRTIWIFVGLYFLICDLKNKSEEEQASKFAILLYVNAAMSIFIFMHMTNIQSTLKASGQLTGESEAAFESVVAAVVPCFTYDYPVGVISNVFLSSTYKTFIQHPELLIIGGGIWAALGFGVVFWGTRSSRNERMSRR